MNRLYNVLALFCLIVPSSTIPAEVESKKLKDFNLAIELVDAVRNGNDEKITKALNDGANLNTALLYAVSSDLDKTTIGSLLKMGANIEAKTPKGSTALIVATSLNDEDMVEFLLNHHAHVNAFTDNKQTALMYAARVNNVKMIELLLKKGADPRLKDSKGKTALDYAREEGNDEVVKLLLKH